MLALVSPAKSLNFDRQLSKKIITSLPRAQTQAWTLIEQLRQLEPQDIASLMSISGDLAHLNYERFASFDQQADCQGARAAALAFDGDVYDGLNASTLSTVQWRHAQKQLRILSGLYGLLRPLDLIQPYRLEMGSRFKTVHANNVYSFWGDQITHYVNEDAQAIGAKFILNLASEEYFKAIKIKQLKTPLITCVFEDEKDNQFKVIGFFAKRARGLMARFVIEHQCTLAKHLKAFTSQGYCFSHEHQDKQTAATVLTFRRTEHDLHAFNATT